jgi:transcription antitermination factor NusG
VETFLPLYSVTKRRKNRTIVKLELPLFASYVFAKIALNETAKVLSVPQVFSLVGNSRGPMPLPDEEIEALRSGLDAGNSVPWPNIKVGTRARITNGPLAGLQGIVIRNNNQIQIVLSVDSISRSFAVHVGVEDIDIIENALPADQKPA